MTIYRGFEIYQDGNEFAVRMGTEIVHRASNEEAALNWVDQEKRRQRQASAQ